MAFLGPDDILVIDKNNGTVQRIVNETLALQPLFDATVATKSERGMVGIAVSPKSTSNQEEEVNKQTPDKESDDETIMQIKTSTYSYTLQKQRIMMAMIKKVTIQWVIVFTGMNLITIASWITLNCYWIFPECPDLPITAAALS